MLKVQEEAYRQISEIQHFALCRRQWARIHIEQQWEENLRTTEGEIMHKRVHDADASESRGDKLIIRGMRVKSDKLCCVGICDAVEFFRNEEGIELHGRKEAQGCEGRIQQHSVEGWSLHLVRQEQEDFNRLACNRQH